MTIDEIYDMLAEKLTKCGLVMNHGKFLCDCAPYTLTNLDNKPAEHGIEFNFHCGVRIFTENISFLPNGLSHEMISLYTRSKTDCPTLTTTAFYVTSAHLDDADMFGGKIANEESINAVADTINTIFVAMQTTEQQKFKYLCEFFHRKLGNIKWNPATFTEQHFVHNVQQFLHDFDYTVAENDPACVLLGLPSTDDILPNTNLAMGFSGLWSLARSQCNYLIKFLREYANTFI